jgi:DNA-binding IclR family transcriptional regulator
VKSALGKAVLAQAPPGMRELLLGPEPFQRFTAATIVGRAALEAELERTRDRGFAVDREENEPGLRCVAPVICSPDGRPAGAISVSGLSERMQQLQDAALGRRIQVHCVQISAALQA